MRNKTLILLATLILAAGAAQSATIFERNGPPLGDPYALGGFSDAILATSWTQNFATTNSDVQIYGLIGPGTELLFQLREGAPVGAVVEEKLLTLTSDVNYNLFSHLALLANTYFLVASVPAPSINQSDAGWQGIDNFALGAILTTAPGVAAGPEFASNSTSGGFQPQDMQLGFRVSENVVPEPASMLLIGLGLTALGFIKRIRRSS